MAGDFSVRVGADFSELLHGFQQLPQQAAQSGRAIGQALGGGIEGQVTRTIDSLMAELGRLRAQKTAVNVDGGQLIVLNQQINSTLTQIKSLQAARLAVKVDPQSIDGLNQKLQSLLNEFGKVKIGSDRFYELQKAIKATEAELGKADESFGAFKGLDGVIQGVAFSLANTLTNAALNAIQALGGIADQVRQFDTARAAVRTLGVNADELAGRLMNLSESTNRNVSANELMKASYDVISSGFSTAADATNILAAAQDGAVGGFTDINTVADATTSVLNAYGMKSDQARKLIDGFIQTQNDGKIVVGQYAHEIGRLAPVAAASGVSIEELNAAVAGATAQGVPVESTFAGLRQAISSILKPSVEASAYAKTLGIDWSASALKAKGFGGVLKEVAEKTGGSAEAIIKLTGSVEAQAAIQPLVNDGLQKYNQFLKNQASSAGVAGQAAAQATATIDGSLKRLGNTFSNLSVQAFDGLTPIVTTVINAFSGVVDAIGKIPGPMKTMLAVAIGVPAVFTAATAAVVIFQGVLRTEQMLQFRANFVSLAATITETFVTGVQAAVKAAPALIAQIGALSKVNATEKIVELAGALKANLVSAFTAAGGAAKGFIAYLQSANFASFIAGARAAVVAIAPMAAAIGALVAMGLVWKQTLGDAQAVQQDFNNVQADSDKALKKLEDALKASGGQLRDYDQYVTKTYNTFQLFWASLAEPMAMKALTEGIGRMQEGFTKGQMSALAFFNNLKKGTTITAEGVQQGKAYIEWLNNAAAAAKQVAGSLRAKADAAEAEGKLQLAAKYREEADALDVEAASSTALSGALSKQIETLGRKSKMDEKDIATTEEQKKAVEARTQAEQKLNEILSQAPVRKLDQQLAVGQQMLGLTKAIADLEESRFAKNKAQMEFVLKQLKDRGASEQEIAAQQAEIDNLDRQALQHKYDALTKQQALENAILLINQEKARLEANLEVLQRKADLLKAQADLQKAMAGTDQFAKNAAQAQYDLQLAILGVTQEKVQTLQKTQPIERAIAAAQAETARNGLQAQAAAEGYEFAADGTLKKTRDLAGSLMQVSMVSGQAADQQARFTSLAEQSGLVVGKTAKGTIVLGESQREVNAAVGDMNRALTQSATGYTNASTAAGRAKSATDTIRDALIKAGMDGKTVAGVMGDIGSKAETTRQSTGGLKDGLTGARGAAGDIANAFVATGKNAPAAAQGARDFAGWLSSARGFLNGIRELRIEDSMLKVKTATEGAASAAKEFYGWLLKASALPGSRWSGGPVEAGAEYRVNELGQEALLSAGRLSLINAPANSVWRAPTAGVVIPAGITARLQEAGAITASGGGATGVAELAVELGKLRQEVGELSRKDWNIHVQQRTGPTASQVLTQIQRLR